MTCCKSLLIELSPAQPFRVSNNFWLSLLLYHSVGNFDYPELVRANSSVAPLFFLSFVLLVFLILVNVFIAIVSDNYDRAKNSIEENQDDHRTRYDLRDLCAQLIRALVPRVLPPKVSFRNCRVKNENCLFRLFFSLVLNISGWFILQTRLEASPSLPCQCSRGRNVSHRSHPK